MRTNWRLPEASLMRYFLSKSSVAILCKSDLWNSTFKRIYQKVHRSKEDSTSQFSIPTHPSLQTMSLRPLNGICIHPNDQTHTQGSSLPPCSSLPTSNPSANPIDPTSKHHTHQSLHLPAKTPVHSTISSCLDHCTNLLTGTFSPTREPSYPCGTSDLLQIRRRSHHCLGQVHWWGAQGKTRIWIPVWLQGFSQVLKSAHQLAPQWSLQGYIPAREKRMTVEPCYRTALSFLSWCQE